MTSQLFPNRKILVETLGGSPHAPVEFPIKDDLSHRRISNQHADNIGTTITFKDYTLPGLAPWFRTFLIYVIKSNYNHLIL